MPADEPSEDVWATTIGVPNEKDRAEKANSVAIRTIKNQVCLPFLD